MDEYGVQFKVGMMGEGRVDKLLSTTPSFHCDNEHKCEWAKMRVDFSSHLSDPTSFLGHLVMVTNMTQSTTTTDIQNWRLIRWIQSIIHVIIIAQVE